MPKRIVFLGVALSAAAALGLAIPISFAGSEATTKLTINASDFKFKPSRPTANAGPIVITLVNKGKTLHDIRVAGKKTRRIASGKRATLRLNLKAGKYKFICTVPGHAALGMRGVLTVKAPPETTEETTEG